MKRPPKTRELRPEETKLWSVVAATVRPAHGRGAPTPAAEAETLPSVPPPEPAATGKAPPRFSGRLKPKGPQPRSREAAPPEPPSPGHIEPKRKRRTKSEWSLN